MANLSTILKSKFPNSGLSKAYVADQLGVGERTIEYYISGEREPTLKGLIKLSELLGFQLNELSEHKVRKIENKPQVDTDVKNIKLDIGALFNELHQKLDSNLIVLLNELADIYNQQVETRAEVRGYEQRQINHEVNWDTKQFLSVMAEVGKLTEQNLKSDPKLGSKKRVRR